MAVFNNLDPCILLSTVFIPKYERFNMLDGRSLSLRSYIHWLNLEQANYDPT